MLKVVFLTAIPACAAFSFLSIGDWGDTAAKENAPEMGKFSPEFVLALGDNFYSDGVKSVDDPQARVSATPNERPPHLARVMHGSSCVIAPTGLA